MVKDALVLALETRARVVDKEFQSTLPELSA